MGYILKFNADVPLPDALSEIGRGGCNADMRGEDFILPLNPGTLELTLIVCRE